MSFVTYQKNDRIAVITLNRPESRNAIAKLEDCDELAEAFLKADADPEVSVVVLTGAGKSFCAGGDLKAIREKTGIGPRDAAVDTRANYRRGVHKVIETIAEVEIVTVAAINGHAIGLGLDIAVLCDLRVAAVSAQMASSFVKVGIVPGDGGAWILTQAVGASRAAELILTGDILTAEDALQLGLVSRVAPDGETLAVAQQMAERVAVNPAQSLRLAKRLLREARHGRLSDVLQLSAAYQALAHETDDHKEAVAAFTEKRAPRFIGR
ncbi:MAG: enoyl-CoA hydratase-related protein [Hyphomonadaceae bacterium]|nr:enoyl-CoA hydratase-related protein [Hyphomonadaceae bacterium]